MLTPEQVWRSIVDQVAMLPAHGKSLADALGQVLVEPVVLDRDLPPADRSAMDGFAVRASDLDRVPAVLSVVGEVAAGSPSEPSVAPGNCARIFTGGNVPPGADTVIRMEDTRTDGTDKITFIAAARKGANIFRRGENASKGSVLVPAGTVLSANHLAACAAAGYPEVVVRRRPSVAIITTGRELLAPDAQPEPHQERDSNQMLMVASLRQAGFSVGRCERVTDQRSDIADRLRATLRGADAVVMSGGVSVGAYDFVPAAVADVEARILVHGVSMKPGKPFLFAITPDGRPIFGLPGNPLSAAVGLLEFVLPALRRMSGVDESACRPALRARLGQALPNTSGRQCYVLGKLTWTAAGPEIAVVPGQGSADVAAGARAEGFIVVPADGPSLGVGSWAEFRPWRVWA